MMYSPEPFIYSREYGSGRPLLFLHGLLGSSDNFHSIALKLSQSYHVICLDLRNHGNSSHTESMTYDEMAADVFRFVSSRRLGSDLIVVGHSLGGRVAMQFASTYPDCLSLLCVIDITPFQYPLRHLPVFDALMGLNLASFSTFSSIESELSLFFPDPLFRGFLLKTLSKSEEGRRGGECFYFKPNILGLFEAYPLLQAEMFIEQIQIPTLFVKGQASDYILDSDRDRLASLFDSYEIEEIENAGHFVYALNPEQFLSVLIGFLSRY